MRRRALSSRKPRYLLLDLFLGLFLCVNALDCYFSVQALHRIFYKRLYETSVARVAEIGDSLATIWELVGCDWILDAGEQKA